METCTEAATVAPQFVPSKLFRRGIIHQQDISSEQMKEKQKKHTSVAAAAAFQSCMNVRVNE